MMKVPLQKPTARTTNASSEESVVDLDEQIRRYHPRRTNQSQAG
jgi:hypothetical protein